MQTEYRIETRWPHWSHWKRVHPKPHGEHNQFDRFGLKFDSLEKADEVAYQMARANSGDVRVIEAYDLCVIKTLTYIQDNR